MVLPASSTRAAGVPETSSVPCGHQISPQGVCRPQHTEEVTRHERATNATTAGSGQLRTLAVRITEDLRAQLDIIAQLTGRSATEEIRLALEHWIEKTKSDPAILQKAEAVRADIERDAQTRRNAIAAIFGGDGTTDETEATAASRSTTRVGVSPQRVARQLLRRN